MPTALIRGVNIVYEVLGDSGPWVALITGGRRGHEEFVSLGRKIADQGFRVLLHDRRNTGASDVVIDGVESEEEIWTDDLYELFKQLGGLPAFVGGASSGARTSILFALRHPEATAGLLLFRVTGGEFAAKRLPENYYGVYIRAAEQGGMAAVCATEQYQERIAANPSNRDRLMAMDPKKYIEVMTNWRDLFVKVAGYPVMGASEAQMGSIKAPTLVVPGNDKTHNLQSGLDAHRLIPGSQLHRLPIDDIDLPLVPFEDWAPLEPEIADTFVTFMRGAARR
jgi:pimeloyl-ACP methyl ester carboxylesterase